jgi:type IV pilus assembly protein PilW
VSRRHSGIRAPSRAQRGFTLMELLMVSLVGGVVIAGTLAMYVNAAESAAYQNAASRVQESGRFALSHIARTLRMAGYDDPDTGVAVPTALRVFDPTNSDRMNNIVKGKTTYTANSSAQAIEVSYEGALSPGGERPVDCNGVGVSPGTVVTNTYVVSSDNELLCLSSEDTSALYVIADGIEDLQFWYGVDSDDDGVANQFFSPSAVSDLTTAQWSNVVAVRIALLVNSVEDVFASTIHGCESCSTFNPTPNRTLRAEFHATVRTRSL